MKALPSSSAPSVPNLASLSLSRVDVPIADAAGLPNFAYTSDWFFAIEREAVFKPHWCCAGFASDAPEVGDVRPFQFLGLPLFMVRGEGGIRVFHNVCSHRGATLVESACRAQNILRCPYHSWSYDFSRQIASYPGDRWTEGQQHR